MNIDDVNELWREFPSNKTAARYLKTTLEYVEDEMLPEDELHRAVRQVSYWLSSRPDVLGPITPTGEAK